MDSLFAHNRHPFYRFVWKRFDFVNWGQDPIELRLTRRFRACHYTSG
jgi:hypothetical protein